MNKAKWKNKKVLPTRILKYLASIAKIKNNQVSYQTTFKNFWLPELDLVKEFLDFKNIDEEAINNSVKKALDICIIAKNVSAEFFLKQLNNECRKHVSKLSDKYLLTSISLEKPENIKIIHVFESKIKFYKKKFPNKFLKFRKELVHKSGDSKNEGYVKCVVITKTYSNEIDIHLNNLNIFRSLVCLSINEGFDIRFDNQQNPLNEIRLGHSHTLHHENGKSVKPHSWFEPGFVFSKPHKCKEINKKSYDIILKKISLSKYRDILINALLIYVKALDEPDHTVALSLLWNSIDKLLNQNMGNYEEIPKRVKKIFGENSRYIDIVEGIRLIRNTYVHDAISNKQSKFYCLALRVLFKKIFFFHIKFIPSGTNFDDALAIIDLLNQAKIAEQVIKIKRLRKNK